MQIRSDSLQGSDIFIQQFLVVLITAAIDVDNREDKSIRDCIHLRALLRSNLFVARCSCSVSSAPARSNTATWGMRQARLLPDSPTVYAVCPVAGHSTSSARQVRIDSSGFERAAHSNRATRQVANHPAAALWL
jgi:hypothetical protein